MRFGPRLRGTQPVSQWLSSGSARIKSIQRGSITIADGTASNTATIASVVTENARLVCLGWSSTNVQQADNAFARIALTNSTTITATRGAASTGGATTVSYEVIEYEPGAIKSVQRGTFAVSSASTTQAITAVATSKSQVDHLGFSHTSATATITLTPRLTLTNSTTLTGDTVTTGAVVGYQVIEWN